MAPSTCAVSFESTNLIASLRAYQQTTDMVTGFYTITPELANDLLRRNTSNRRVKYHAVVRYAVDMANDRWQKQGAPIQIDKEGRILDGQHRLMACARSGFPFSAFITFNVDSDSFLSLDKGIKRSGADDLYLENEANSTKLATVLTALYTYEIGKSANTYYSRGSGVSSQERRGTLERHPGIRESVEFTKNFGGWATPMALVHHLGSALGRQEDTEDFLRGVKTGEQLSASSPALLLKNKITTDRSPQSYRLAVSIKALNSYLTGRPLRALSWNPAHEFPKLNGDEIFGSIEPVTLEDI